ncbi:hypothetical protein [Cupriavidus pauculus]|uniref:hypothetical protein n=1 Tax=Cupriavidus pauculus TaxID=82633 RepID=UPI001EE31A35|nr:hypothetical protein [Cupriavidus pauculus]GJG96967.1 hypothetical protein CBA19C6_20780 [Cupriavidus pauculus]
MLHPRRFPTEWNLVFWAGELTFLLALAEIAVRLETTRHSLAIDRKQHPPKAALMEFVADAFWLRALRRARFARFFPFVMTPVLE